MNEAAKNPTSLLSTWITRAIAIGSFVAVVASAVAIWIAAPRGIDLTDEGIYLATYRAFRRPELNFTGTPAILGPLFELLGWNIPALRRAKLLAFLVMSGVLGFVVERTLLGRLRGRETSGPEQCMAVVLLTMLGGLTIYSLLPQTPGYNDVAIFLTMAAVAITLGCLADGPSRGSCIGLGFVGVLLLLVKFPSAMMVGAGCILVLVTRRRTTIPVLLRTLFVGGAAGAVLGLGALQLLSGDIIGRLQGLVRSNDTSVKGQTLSEAYGDVYARAVADIVHALVPLVVLALLAALATRLMMRRAPWPAALVFIGASGAIVLFARRRSVFAGGSAHGSTLQAAFPFLTALVFIGILAVRRPLRTSSLLAALRSTDRTRGDLVAGVALLLAAPTLQAIGTGSSPFVIAGSAGALWMGGFIVLLMWQVPRRGASAFVGLGTAGAVSGAVWLLGAPALWLTPFRVAGDLRDQTTPVRGVPYLAGLRTDRETAEFLENAHAVASEKRVLGKPGFSSFAGVGVAYALELRQPPAGMYVYESFPNVLKGRVADACEIGAMGPSNLPVVLTDTKFPATIAALGACGIDFPGGFEAVDLVPPPFLRELGVGRISIWTPKV